MSDVMPIPDGRGRWRLTLHHRVYAAGIPWQQSIMAELTNARGRRLDELWNQSAQLTFTMDGRRSEAGLIQELTQDVLAWRWDETQGQDQLMFRGPITQAEDQIDTESHVVTFTCHDYLAVLARRYLTSTLTYTATDQDSIVAGLLSRAINAASSSGTSFLPASWLPLQFVAYAPDLSARGNSGQLRDRQYLGQQEIGVAIDDLAKVQGGFDYDVFPRTDSIGIDDLRVFYPYQGMTRPDVPLIYGSNIATVTRALNSADYANYWRILGNNSSADPTAPQLYGETWNADANNITPAPQGLWMNIDSGSDVTLQNTLSEQAAGHLALSAALTPSYTLGLTPDGYSYGTPNMGDVVPLIINTGRLNVNTNVRVLGISYAIGDDGQEDVSLTVSRPTRNLTDLYTAHHFAISALNRR